MCEILILFTEALLHLWVKMPALLHLNCGQGQICAQQKYVFNLEIKDDSQGF